MTLMAVHAHPDDEASSTGGVLARYSSEGVRCVVVTCTNGELGDGPNGEKPGEPGHDDVAVAATRLDELDEACRILGVAHAETLGYRDSGMHGWDGNGHGDAFCNVAVDAAAARLARLIEHYRPTVVITYAANGGYGHPDHIQAHRITHFAIEHLVKDSIAPAKLYHTARPRSVWTQLRELLAARGIELPPPPPRPEGQEPPGTPDDAITTVIDVDRFVDRKLAALQAHGSQTSRSANLSHPEVFREIFGREWFVLARGPALAERPETDLFAGLR